MIVVGALVILGSLALGSTALMSAQVVDLKGKKGVVDPADLKKHDPPEKSLHTTPPPSPQTTTGGGKGDSRNTGVNPTNGGLPPSGNGGTGAKPTPPPEKPRVVPPVRPPVPR